MITRLMVIVALLVGVFGFVLTGPQSVGAAAEAQTYIVQPGDSLSRIARRFGFSSWEPIYKANSGQIADPDLIYEGQALVIPSNDGTVQVSVPESTPPQPVAAKANYSNGNGIIDIIVEAANYYGQSPDDMIAVARCESELDPSNYNDYSGASGLFQFLPSTWASTPYADQDIFDPWANAYAASWMWSVGRQNEWVCQP